MKTLRKVIAFCALLPIAAIGSFASAEPATLGKGYHVELDDFEAVLIRKAGKTPNFDLVLEKSTISGLSIDLKRK